MKEYAFTIPAAGTYRLPVNGNFFMLKESSGGGLRFIVRDSEFNLEVGRGVKNLPFVFQHILIFNDSVLPLDVVLLVGFGEFIDNRLIGNVEVSNNVNTFSTGGVVSVGNVVSVNAVGTMKVQTADQYQSVCIHQETPGIANYYEFAAVTDPAVKAMSYVISNPHTSASGRIVYVGDRDFTGQENGTGIMGASWGLKTGAPVRLTGGQSKEFFTRDVLRVSMNAGDNTLGIRVQVFTWTY